MHTAKYLLAIFTLFLFAPQNAISEDNLFKDDFKHKLSPEWKVVGLKETDYRIRNGGLEMRVQPGKLTRDMPMIKVILPLNAEDAVIASVKVTVLDEFTKDHEFAGICYLDESGPVFGAKKEQIEGKLAFAPGKYEFKGKEGEEGNLDKYEAKYTPETNEAGPLRIIVNSGYAFFQVGPSPKGEYRNFFQSAIVEAKQERGFCLVAAGAPEGESHWVRFEEFRVLKQ
jgi:hypothetical protein